MTDVLLHPVTLPVSDAPLRVHHGQALALRQGHVIAHGGAAQLRADPAFADLPSLDGHNRLVTPGLIDAHTHLIWAGSRAMDHAKRLGGVPYAQISREGGGIVRTVAATRQASQDQLVQRAIPRAQALVREGVTTLEVKSGYGLTVQDELKCLRAARALQDHVPVRIVTTLLAAHAVPPEHTADSWVDVIVNELLPAAVSEGLADAVDVYCEGIGFSVAQCQRVWEAARAAGLPIKGHTEQLSNLGGSVAAAALGARSVDHIEYLDPADAPALAAAGTIAMLLPVAFYTLRETQLPPLDALRAAGVPLAVATDANPGTAPFVSLRLAAHMAMTTFGLTPTEAWQGITQHAATALSRPDLGHLHAGATADLAVWNTQDPAEVLCAPGEAILHGRFLGGTWHPHAEAHHA